MDSVSSSPAISSPSLVITNHSSLSLQLMTATGNPASGGSTGATSNKQTTPLANRKVLSSDLNNYNLDHLYCHSNEKKTQSQPVSPYTRGIAAPATAGGLPPTTDMSAVLKEIKQLKAMLLLHLDLIQEQSDQLASKDKLILNLRKDNDSLRLRLTELAMAPSSSVAPPTTATFTSSSSPVVITKSGRFSKPVLPLAVAKDDVTNKVQPATTHTQSHSANATHINQQHSMVADLLPKDEPLDSSVDDQQPVPDAKSEILKKFSNKLLANYSEKLNTLTATIESEYLLQFFFINIILVCKLV